MASFQLFSGEKGASKAIHRGQQRIFKFTTALNIKETHRSYDGARCAKRQNQNRSRRGMSLPRAAPAPQSRTSQGNRQPGDTRWETWRQLGVRQECFWRLRPVTPKGILHPLWHTYPNHSASSLCKCTFSAAEVTPRSLFQMKQVWWQ